jgi:hypothetical protein
MKPKIKKQSGQWMCGGLFVSPWYIDWFVGNSPENAYQIWKKNQ